MFLFCRSISLSNLAKIASFPSNLTALNRGEAGDSGEIDA